MPKLRWDETDSRYISTGLDRGVLYLRDGIGVPWSGLVSVNETPSGGESSSIFYDGSKFFSNRTPESLEGSISAYTYPREFSNLNGFDDFLSGQPSESFDFSYRTRLINDLDDLTPRHLIHILYDVRVSSLKQSHNSISGSPSANLFQWNFVTTPQKIANRLGSQLIIDTGMADPTALSQLENMLYGTDDSFSYLPRPQEVIDLFENVAILKITDHGDGTWSAEGPDEVVRMLTDTLFEISWPSVIYIDSTTYEISSL